MSWSARSSMPINSTARRRMLEARTANSPAMFDFLKRNQLVKRGLASGKTRRRRVPNEMAERLEYAAYAKWVIFAAFLTGLALLIFNGEQPEPTKNFVVALLFFGAAVLQLWINQPVTFVRSSRLLLVFGI